MLANKLDWARSYNRDYFTANTHTTSRCESMHASIKRRFSRFNGIRDIADIMIDLDTKSITPEKDVSVSLLCVLIGSNL